MKTLIFLSLFFLTGCGITVFDEKTPPAPVATQVQTDEQFAEQAFTDLRATGGMFDPTELTINNKLTLRTFFSESQYNAHKREILALYLQKKYDAIAVYELDADSVYMVISSASLGYNK